MYISQQKLLKFYSNPTIQKLIFKASVDREFVTSFVDSKGIRKPGMRPNVLNEPGDIYSYVARGANEFHISVERWYDVMLLKENKTQDEINNNRKDWDFIIDVDIDEGFSYAKIIANELFLFLVGEGIPKEDIFVKFSGNRGFHIGVRGEEFPKRVPDFKGILKSRSLVYPFLPLFILYFIEEKVSEKITQKYLKNKLQDNPQDINNFHSKSTPLSKLKLDFQVFSSRHLIRSPYSIHPKTGFVSLPIPPENILSFKKEQATIDNVLSRKSESLLGFLDKFSEEKASKLVSHAFAWFNKKDKNQQQQILNKINQSVHNQDFTKDLIKIDARKKKEGFVEVLQHGNSSTKTQISFDGSLINYSYFPPTINNILKGLSDGRKRALFILINFFRNLNYSQEQIERLLKEWNLRNKSPLSERYIHQQIFYNFKHEKPLLPPSFSSEIYKELGVYEEDELTKKVKNPLTYVYNKIKYRQKNKKTKKKINQKSKEEETKEKKKPDIDFALEKKYFPPVINILLKGISCEKLNILNDKECSNLIEQAATILINFFRLLGESVSSFYTQDKIKQLLYEWNEHNQPPLSKKKLAQKIRSNFMRKKAKALPSLNSKIYKDLGVYEEDELTKKVKNPLTYVKKRIKEEHKN